MSKIKRYYEKEAIYSITCNTYLRIPIFHKRRAAEFLMNTLGYYKIVLNYSLYCYCIMPDHIHLIIQPHLKKYNISVIMKHIKGSFARSYNNITRKDGIIWQRRFYDSIIASEEELTTKISYIIENPVKEGLVKEAKEYPYSSARTYLEDINDFITDKYITK